ncbi:glycerol dehydrogenase [Lentilactobacillus kefiri]|nr:glycerol dehydrogenase [Lentilactobacillus kefiri]MCJ2162359.1 glycerol dehydrogenase [Lentilactobacillus kefiri]MDH5108929.1 glycerol dehydrogenase [Lentilactobacillus kefiri]PAK59056.1 glycerol dehydrogenase [Lentilactobacillus kefiri]PAK82089.1 glycerol dehydrogenase [Lentilactobacillus kefiri]PAL05765.1 glycerol dehydrogenase [Lentilactobacillus kefiri]
MTTAFASPSTYVQGKNLLDTAANYIKPYGNNGLLLTDEIVWGLVGEKFYKTLTDAGLDIEHVTFNGESSPEEIDRIKKIGESSNAKFVISLGGGKTNDTTKAVGDQLKIPVVIVPTLASNDSPCTRLSVIYSENGEFLKYIFYDKNPDLVLVDSSVIAGAPVKFLIDGMADALSTNVEAQTVARARETTLLPLQTQQTAAGLALAEKCEELLFKYGNQAVTAAKNHQVTPALEHIIEANTLLSGVGAESSGLAAAHSFQNGLTALSGDVHKMSHGQKVSFGTLLNLVLEGASDATLEKYLKFEHDLGLPTTLKDLHLEDASDEDLMKVAQLTTQKGETIHNMGFKVTADDVFEGIKAVDTFAKKFEGIE